MPLPVIRSRARAALGLLVAGLLVVLAGRLTLAGRGWDPHRVEVHVQWTERALPRRPQLEQALGLIAPSPREGRTWVYQLADPGPVAIERLVRSPDVEGTADIDRERFRVVDEGLPPVMAPIVERQLWLPVALLLLCGAALLGAWARVAVRAVGETLASPRVVPAVAAVLTCGALAVTLRGRPEDSAFVHLYEVPSILAGEHPYRDFFEWGAPLPVYLSAGVQWLVGYRVIGEVLLQDAFIVSGVAMACALAARVASAPGAILTLLPAVWLILLRTPSYHYSKLFCFPVAVWLAWQYLARPAPRQAAWLGAFVGVSFLFRHDYLLWTGLAAVVAVCLTRLVSPRATLRSAMRDVALAGFVALVVVTPFLLAVASGEGLRTYVRARTQQFEGAGSVLSKVVQTNPIRIFRPAASPPPEAGEFVFAWLDGVPPALQAELIARHGLAPVSEGDGRLRVRLANRYDVALLDLHDVVWRDSGVDWGALQEVAARRPAPLDGLRVLMQASVLTAVALILTGVALWRRARAARPEGRLRALQLLHGGIFLLVTAVALFREPGYVGTTAPLTAALGAALVVPVWRGRARDVRGGMRGVVGGAVAGTLQVLVLLVVTVAALVANGGARDVGERIRDAAADWPATVRELASAPPLVRDEEAYVRDCSHPDDHLLVTGNTPFYVTYFARRPLAGGHLYWHSGFRAAPELQAASLALLMRQPVPFAISGSGPVLADFDHVYPQVAAHLRRYYAALPGTSGRLLVDTRLTPVGVWGPHGWPCFVP